MLQTVRVPELAPKTSGLDLSLSDMAVVWIASENLTKKISLQELNTFFGTGGGGGTHAPAVIGGEYIYIVPSAHAGTDSALIPSLAGLDFSLERSGIPMIALLPDNSNASVAEFEILDAGGFKLLQAGDILTLNERFKLTIYSLIGTTPGPTNPTAATFLQGKKLVNTNTALDPVQDVNKLIQIRGNTDPITLTLPSVGDIAANSIIAIETNITNTKPATIATSGGQLIYLNNGSKTTLYMMPGEVMWLYRDDDGFYMIGDFYRNYRNLATPIPSYQAELNQLVCKGQLVNRADYPRLWEKVQTLGSSLVTDAVWSLAQVYRQGNTYTTTPPGFGFYTVIERPNRGCFSTGDGSTTFRLPDLMNLGVRGVKTETGSDNERYLNKPGGYQDDEIVAHTHPTTTDGLWNESGNGHFASGGNTNEGATALATGSTGGAETRMENFGVLWVINV